jgi:competence protein ComEA
MINLGMNDRISGLLVLLLTLLLFYSLKPAFNYSRPQRFPFEELFFIQVEGNIKFPGVYAFGHPPTLTELMGRAGGMSFAAAQPKAFENFAVLSGAKVTVLGDEGEWTFYQGEISAFYKLTLGMAISLNKESEEGLTAIPGIGLGLAKSIVQERVKRGGFESLDEVLSISGISHKLYNKIKPYLTL